MAPNILVVHPLVAASSVKELIALAKAKSGKLRALAVTGARPSALFPGLPTVEVAAGLPGYDVTTRTGLFASGKPPRTVINRLNREIVRALNRMGADTYSTGSVVAVLT